PAMAEGKEYPVLRLPALVPMTTGRVRPLPEDRTFNKRITLASMDGGRPSVNLSGSPVRDLTWLEDGEHFLQVRDRRLMKVHARTGRSQPFHDPEKVVQSLGALPALDPSTVQSLARRTSYQMNPQRTGFLFESEDDLYFASFDGSKAVRLTRTPGRKELTS